MGIVIEYENNFVGLFFKAPDVINKRETYLSENGRFGIWYDSENNDWNLGFEEDMGTAKSIVYLDLDSESYFKSDRGFVFNSKGTELWEGKDKEELVEVTCSSKKGWKHFCGGSILNENWIITAAHCLTETNVNNFYVRMGEYDMATIDELLDFVERKVRTIVIHPKYRGSYQDIALDSFLALHNLMKK